MHLKSLDHMGIQAKGADKRQLSAKHLVDVIKTKHEEQKRARLLKSPADVPSYQFMHQFSDQEVLLDLLRFMVIYATQGGQHNALERRRILEFFETFIPQFFDLSEEKVRDKLADIDQDSAEEDEDEPAPVELTNGRSRRNGKQSNLLRGVLDPGRNGSRSRTQKEDSAASGKSSKETTPDAGSGNDEEMPDAEDAALPEISNDRWLPMVPRPTVVKKTRNGTPQTEDPLVTADGDLRADAPFKRSWYNFYCNQNIFVFYSVFQALYQRLFDVKESSDSVLEQIRRESAEKPGKTLGLVSEDIKFFDGIKDPQNNADKFWPRTVGLIEDYITGEIDEARFQDVLRHYYLKKGWKLYTIMDLLKTLCRIGLACNNPDSKGEKTKELVKEYLASRQQDETSYQTEISARKFAEKCIKDGEMFVICWVRLVTPPFTSPPLKTTANTIYSTLVRRRLASAGYNGMRQPLTTTRWSATSSGNTTLPRTCASSRLKEWTGPRSRKFCSSATCHHPPTMHRTTAMCRSPSSFMKALS
jgi:paired amphipathic helix protein Sin3a